LYKFNRNRISFYSYHICRHNNFYISGCPPSWICDDILLILLHTVIDLSHHHCPTFSRDWYSVQASHMRHCDRQQTDRQTNRQTKSEKV